MKLVVRVQYIGERARLLLRDDLAAEWTQGLIDDLEYFGFPLPHEQKPIEKSGFMLCVWHADRDSDVHHAIQNAFIKAKAEAPFLLERSIRYISLNEDGVMHTTSLSNKPYKPKTYTYNKPDYQNHQSGNNHNPHYKPYGKAPKYPTIISQARKAATPLSQRIAGADTHGHGSTMPGHYVEPSSGDAEMYGEGDSGTRTPPTNGSDGSNSVIDVTQQTLKQLSQSSAFRSLMLRSPPIPSPVKVEDASPSDISSLLSAPAQHPIPNLQALLEKAGVKSASAQALLASQSKTTVRTHTGVYTAPITGVNAVPIASTSAVVLGTQPTASLDSSSVISNTLSSIIPKSITSTPVPVPRSSAANHATRELWDVRRQITALQARENSLVSDLQKLGQPVPPMEGGGSSEHRLKALEGETEALKEELKGEMQSRRVLEALLRAERGRRAELEGMMKDTTRECKQPFVVPALLDAFMKIGQMTGDALKDAHSSTVPMEL